MLELLGFIKEYESSLTLLTAFLVMISTVIYAVLTGKLMLETIKMRKAQTDPKVVLYLKQSDASHLFLDVVIENIGTGQAYDIKITIIKELQIGEQSGTMLSSLGFIKHGVTQLAPSQSIKAWYFSFLGIYDDVIDKEIELHVVYRNELREPRSEKVYINLNQYKNITTIGEDPIKVISKNVEGIKRSAEKIANGPIKVETYDRNDRLQKKQDIEGLIEKHREQQKQKSEIEVIAESSDDPGKVDA